MKRLTLLVLACGAAIEAIAAPPPPPVYPEDLPQTLDGYAMTILYSRYSFWIEEQKGAVIDAMMAEPAEVVGYRPLFVPPISFKLYSDYGHFQSGDIRSYCRVTGEGQVDRSDCQFVLRIVAIPRAAIDRTGPVGLFMRKSFDPGGVVAGLKANAIRPDADMWRIDGNRLFGGLPSATGLLRDNAKVMLLDSRQCPAMQREIAALEGQQLPQRIDISLLGDDGALPPPPPHAVRREDKLVFRADGEFMTITSWSGGLYRLLSPVYDAADACLKDRAAAK